MGEHCTNEKEGERKRMRGNERKCLTICFQVEERKRFDADHGQQETAESSSGTVYTFS